MSSCNKIIYDDVSEILKTPLRWGDFHGKTILITGASGFLAGYVVETLMHLHLVNVNPARVICLVRNIEKAKSKFHHHLNRPEFGILKGDVCDLISIDGDIDIIIHAASHASPIFYSTDPVGTIDANVIGTKNMLELARAKNTSSFLFISSGEIYGAFDAKHSLTQENDMGYLDCTSVRACYAESKRLGENYCVAYAHQFGLDTKIVRPFHTYGPSIDLNDGRVFSDFVSDILNKRNIVLKSDGLSMRPFCYITDAIYAFFLVILNGEKGNAYNVGNPDQEISMLNLANLLVDEFTELGLEVNRIVRTSSDTYVQSTVMRNCPSIEKITKLGWNPKVNLATGFRRTVESFTC